MNNRSGKTFHLQGGIFARQTCRGMWLTKIQPWIYCFPASTNLTQSIPRCPGKTTLRREMCPPKCISSDWGKKAKNRRARKSVGAAQRRSQWAMDVTAAWPRSLYFREISDITRRGGVAGSRGESLEGESRLATVGGLADVKGGFFFWKNVTTVA